MAKGLETDYKELKDLKTLSLKKGKFRMGEIQDLSEKYVEHVM